MNKKRYLVHGGYITSKNDGDRHYISARKLALLYQLDPEECYFIDKNDVIDHYGYRMGVTLFPELIHLKPRYHGDYLEHLDFVCEERLKKYCKTLA